MSASLVPQPTAQPQDSESSIYHTLAKHQREESWEKRDLLELLQCWAEVFNSEFKLDIPKLALCVDKLPANCYGHFREGHNGFGLEGEIAINSLYFDGSIQLWHLLGVLLHEELHAWQFFHGGRTGRNHHDTTFRGKAQELGLIVDRRGWMGFAAQSLFKDLLRRFGIEVPDVEVVAIARPRAGNSKLKKWSCACPVNVRVAIADFDATCNKCGRRFVRSDGAGAASPAPHDAKETHILGRT